MQIKLLLQNQCCAKKLLTEGVNYRKDGNSCKQNKTRSEGRGFESQWQKGFFLLAESLLKALTSQILLHILHDCMWEMLKCILLQFHIWEMWLYSLKKRCPGKQVRRNWNLESNSGLSIKLILRKPSLGRLLYQRIPSSRICLKSNYETIKWWQLPIQISQTVWPQPKYFSLLAKLTL